MNIRTLKVTMFAGWILLLAHSGIASPRYIYHNWTISTPIGRFGFQEISGSPDETLASVLSGRPPPTERYFCLGPVGSTRTSMSSSTVRMGGCTASIVALALLAWAAGNGVRKRLACENDVQP